MVESKTKEERLEAISEEIGGIGRGLYALSHSINDVCTELEAIKEILNNSRVTHSIDDIQSELNEIKEILKEKKKST